MTQQEAFLLYMLYDVYFGWSEYRSSSTLDPIVADIA
jgi:hypothetical protein